MDTLKDLLYSNDHEWVKVDENNAYVGITDFAQHKMGDIVFVDLPRVDDELSQGDIFTVIESVKAASDCLLPVSGKVLEVNEELSDKPEILNSDPYGNFICLIEMTDESELSNLMGEEEYIEFCKKEQE
ncbi:MAG: glycine cleavage system protein GcvH [Oscillospiraceae bacterium]|nr:glycine cleavage system protein GcvH [Oscillospiraceae bacterium]